MRIYPAPHYTMGGLWVDYYLESTIPGLFVIGEANFSDHGANRLGASALMQGLADGYFVLPLHVAQLPGLDQAREGDADHDAVKQAMDKVQTGSRAASLNGKGTQDGRPVPSRAGQDHVGLLRHGAHRRRAAEGAQADSCAASAEFWENVRVLGERR